MPDGEEVFPNIGDDHIETDPSGEVQSGNSPASLDIDRIRRCSACNCYLCTVDVYSNFVVEGLAIVRNIKCWKCGKKNDVKIEVKISRA
jgi:hypothetical protein